MPKSRSRRLAPARAHQGRVRRFRASHRELYRFLMLSVGPNTFSIGLARHASNGSINDGTRPYETAFPCDPCDPWDQRQQHCAGGRARNACCDGLPGSGRWRERHCAGTGECERPQRLDQRPKRHRQRGEDAGASTACDQAGDTHHRCAAQLDTALAAPIFGACPRDEAAADAVRVVARPARCGTRCGQGERPAAQTRRHQHLPGMLMSWPVNGSRYDWSIRPVWRVER
jgi:hypothetical protein